MPPEPRVDDEDVRRILDASMDEQYAYFVEEVAAWETVWGLWLGDGWATALDGDRRQFAAWPHRRFAEECVQDVWERGEPAAIEIYGWLELLDEIEARGHAVAVHQRPDGRHVPVEPDRLRADIEEALDGFEPLEDEDGPDG